MTSIELMELKKILEHAMAGDIDMIAMESMYSTVSDELSKAEIEEFIEDVHNEKPSAYGYDEDAYDRFYSQEWTISFGKAKVSLPNCLGIYDSMVSVVKEILETCY